MKAGLDGAYMLEKTKCEMRFQFTSKFMTKKKTMKGENKRQ
jgi:hypothetical protein